MLTGIYADKEDDINYKTLGYNIRDYNLSTNISYLNNNSNNSINYII